MKLSNIVLHAYGVTAAQAVSCEKNKPHFGAYFMLRFTPPHNVHIFWCFELYS